MKLAKKDNKNDMVSLASWKIKRLVLPLDLDLIYSVNVAQLFGDVMRSGVRLFLIALVLASTTITAHASDREWGESHGTDTMFGGSPDRAWGEERPAFGSPEMIDELTRQVQSGMPVENQRFEAGELSTDEKSDMVHTGITANPRNAIGELVNSIPRNGAQTSIGDGTIQYLKTDELQKLFPEYMFYIVRFPKYPISRTPPDGLSTNNIFIAKKTGRMSLIASTDELQAFFTTTQSAESDSRARLLVYTWLQLATELIQDGMYKFAIADNAVTVNVSGTEMVANGKAAVDQAAGNKGEVFVTMIFDAGGKLRAVEEKNTVQPGMRPI